MASSVINKSTDARKTVRNLFFTTNLNWEAGRALKFEGSYCGVKQTKKRAVLFRVTFENTAIINNFPGIWLGLKMTDWHCQHLNGFVNKLTDWMNNQNSFSNVPNKFLVWNIFPFRDVILKVEKI